LLALALVLGGLLLALSEARSRDDKKPDFRSLSAQEFVTKASAAGLAEVNLSRLAQERASRTEVKDFARRMVEDHGKANLELLRLAEAKKLNVAQRMDEKHQTLFERLVGLRGTDFDREYSQAMLKDHEEAVALFSEADKSLDDKDLKAWAGKTLPTLREHLEMARKINNLGAEKNPKEKDR
jgi:putative membrane protein